MCDRGLVERVRRIVLELKSEDQRLVEDVLERMGPEKHLLKYVLEVLSNDNKR